MPDPNELRLDKLEAALDAHGMNLSIFDGYVTALWVMPEVPTDQWMTHVLSREDGESTDVDPALPGVIVDHFNAVGFDLRTEVYNPIYWLDEDGTEMWELWAEGFGRAIAHRPEFMEATMTDEESEAAQALGFMLALAGLALGDEDLAEEITDGDVDELKTHASELLMQGLVELYTARRRANGSDLPRQVTKVGRNDPCSCGSGKKFKNCCGAAG
ncbi:UPF0149 family protein [Asticcacaulis sp. AC402]|uniref:YecA/YgfB family protein n=1 Tax=Asticcacaulis sp. AC402 TaxID=1282361 RepID=UPI0003C3C29E|nr:UPF0149 family protein [Asticcacaulis sp. AC402]ESQ75223.1 hypothetical protein ABAC402_10270 [Asticcacaulis sp. AC402]